MKHVLLFISSLLFGVTICHAQEVSAPKHVFGVRAGLDITKPLPLDNIFDETESENKFGAGFHIGGTYQIALSKARKWYFQTGLYLRYNTGTSCITDMDSFHNDYDEYSVYNHQYRALYIEIPAMFVRNIGVTDDWIIQPIAGLSYSFGAWGKYKEEYTFYDNNEPNESVNEESDLFGDEWAKWAKNGVNLRVGVNVIYKKYLFGVDISYGEDLWGVGINLGYNF